MGDPVNPSQAKTRLGGTVILPILKHWTETPTQCTVAPSGSSVGISCAIRSATLLPDAWGSGVADPDTDPELRSEGWLGVWKEGKGAESPDGADFSETAWPLEMARDLLDLAFLGVT